MPKDRWAVHLCSCNGVLPVEAKEIGRLAGLDAPPSVHANLGREGAGAYWKEAQMGADFHLVCCCGAGEDLNPALEEAGVEEEQIVHLDVKGGAFWRGEDPESGNLTAARLIRSAIARTEARRGGPSLSISVPSSVLIYTDRPEGLRLAERLADQMDVRVIIDEDAENFDELSPARRPYSLTRGRVTQIKGHLGAFRARLRARQAIDLDACTRCGRCAPVCHTGAITQGLRLIAAKCDECGDCLKECADVGAIKIPRNEAREVSAGQVVAILEGAPAPDSGLHSGYHLIAGEESPDVDAIAFRVAALEGEFIRPSYISYDESICAGGTADVEGCEACLPECPYDALSRAGARIRVDEEACEGCGGCVSVCPTSALSLRTPSAGEIHAQLRAALAVLPGEKALGRELAVVFHCGEKGAEALRVAGENRWPLGGGMIPIEVPCLRYVSEALILQSYRLGAAGVALLGCADCPSGERPLMSDRLALCGAALDAFGFGAGRLAQISVEASEEAYYLASAVGELGAFLERLEPAPLPGLVGSAPGAGNSAGKPEGGRDLLIDAVRAFVGATGLDPGEIVGETALPFARVRVQKAGCTLCGGCVFVCPTGALHASDPGSAMTEAKTLEFNHLKCIACGMCDEACPEKVVTIERGVSMGRAALAHVELVRDEMVACISCGREYINKQALETIIGKMLGLDKVGDTFEGERKDLLRMCPDCRGAHAVREVERGWQP
jgi:ferredoxin/coenzyme F420-reducing hydrogenase delta subunit